MAWLWSDLLPLQSTPSLAGLWARGFSVSRENGAQTHKGSARGCLQGPAGRKDGLARGSCPGPRPRPRLILF